jgi:hypothetical protein
MIKAKECSNVAFGGTYKIYAIEHISNFNSSVFKRELCLHHSCYKSGWSSPT